MKSLKSARLSACAYSLLQSHLYAVMDLHGQFRLKSVMGTKHNGQLFLYIFVHMRQARILK